MPLLALGCGGEAAEVTGVAGPVLHGCTANGYVDRRAPTASRSVFYGGAADAGALSYAPACMVIAPGQTVRFDGLERGTFSVHPLVPGPVQGVDAGALPNNPIVRADDGRAAVEVRFDAAGVYPYHCEYHQPSMAGVIVVRP